MCLTRLEKASIPELPTLTVTYNDDDDDDDIENKQGRPPPSPQRAMSQYSLHFSILKRGQFFAASDKFRGKVFGDGMGGKTRLEADDFRHKIIDMAYSYNLT